MRINPLVIRDVAEQARFRQMAGALEGIDQSSAKNAARLKKRFGA